MLESRDGEDGENFFGLVPKPNERDSSKITQMRQTLANTNGHFLRASIISMIRSVNQNDILPVTSFAKLNIKDQLSRIETDLPLK